MRVNLNLQQFSREFSNVEQTAIVASCIESAYRYDYEAVARTIDMPGRTVFAGRGSWRTKGMLTDYIMHDDATFQAKYNLSSVSLNQTDMERLNRKLTLLNDSLQVAGFERWVSEFMKIYSLNWIVSRITYVLTTTRPGVTQDNIEFNLNLLLESVN